MNTPATAARATRILGFLGVLAAAALGACSRSEPATVAKAEPLAIKVLSNRADLVSGGDALVEITGAGDRPTVDVNGLDVSAAFGRRANGRVMGLVTGLAAGPNVVTARGAGAPVRITITNHPIGGPIIAGAQVQPWDCTTASNGLGAAADAQCNAPTTYAFFYRPTGGGAFLPYDPDNPPGNVANTTTDQGKTVPYIIRQETGTQNRGIYRIAVLFDPAQDWQPWAPQEAWNGKLHYPFGFSCATIHDQGDAQDVQNDRALSRGFMVASSSLNELGQSCNTWVSAESVMMLKERIVEAYGEIRYTMAEGCSGGSIGQHMVANMYPGLLQGIQPNCSFMDNWSTGLEVIDCHLLLGYYRSHPSVTAEQQTAINGHAGPTSCESWEALFAEVVNPEGGCFRSSDARDYDAVDNPTGCRGSVQDFNVGVVGKRPSALWDAPAANAATNAAEHAAGGFSRFPYDNRGVQYGLKALLEGRISPALFVDINEKVGTVDVDFNFMPGRRLADTGSEIVYRAGGINDGGSLDQVAIIDLRGTSNNEIHTDYHSYGMRARLDKANGHHDNQIIWTSPTPLVPAPAEATEAFLLLDRWLTAVENDRSSDPLEVKVVRNKPQDATDACFINDEKITDPEACAAAFPYFGSPRLVAGMPITHDMGSCQLQALDREDYPAVVFTDDQWARLQAVFPEGVCDYSKPALGEQPSIPWLRHDGAGGVPLGAPPSSALPGT
jgi:hypothetical protein